MSGWGTSTSTPATTTSWSPRRTSPAAGSPSPPTPSHTKLCSRDGYDALALAPVLVDEECAPNLTQAVQNHFQVRRLVVMVMVR